MATLMIRQSCVTTIYDDNSPACLS